MLKKTPHKRKIRIFIRQGIFLLLIFSVTLVCLISFYYIVIVKRNSITSPLASFRNTLFHQQKPNDITKKIEDQLKKSGISTVFAASSANNTTRITLQDNQEVIFANTKDIEQQIASLQLIMRQLTIEGKRFNRVDFRFDNPVITF